MIPISLIKRESSIALISAWGKPHAKESLMIVIVEKKSGYVMINELYASFYKLQETDILARISTESNEINKAILQNSLKEIQGKLNEWE